MSGKSSCDFAFGSQSHKRVHLSSDTSPFLESYYENTLAGPAVGGTVCDSFTSRILIRPNVRGFLPSTATIGIISSVIKHEYEEPWTDWREVPRRVRDMWWSEFQWDPQFESTIKWIWGLKCADTIKANLAALRSGQCKGRWLSDEVFRALRRKWREAFKEQSERQEQNRAVSEGGYVNQGGSIDTSQHKMQYATRRRNKRGRAYGFGPEAAFYSGFGSNSQCDPPPQYTDDELTLLELRVAKLQSQLEEERCQRMQFCEELVEQQRSQSKQYVKQMKEEILKEMEFLKQLMEQLEEHFKQQPGELAYLKSIIAQLVTQIFAHDDNPVAPAASQQPTTVDEARGGTDNINNDH